ncbi:nuclear transport factor 2 family protein [Kineobactrum salinum]|uniref:Nuclear transport factor 2 family protein n=1 Tax=Kineobactrum salinum TaxID=2708301 RepID=A0A6C0TX66_9GAMM|nr:nuclear transport factor 2 family protein [Kineobactrum salinum]QIB64113.1 nuclear transport factor 2 family protein [Kineobactrum salinum]
MTITTEFRSGHIEILDLSARFAWLIDHEEGRGVPELFVSEGRYGYEGYWCEGREAIEDFYERRRQPGTRKSRHIFTNHLIRIEKDRAFCTSNLILFATDGDAEANANPLSVLDYHDILVRDGDGNWRYLERRVVPAFGHMPKIMEKESGA